MSANGTADLSADAGPSTSPRHATSPATSPRLSLDDDDSLSPAQRVELLEKELATTRQDKETLGNQYRSLLGKLTAMRQSLGDKLREDAEELDRRETAIHTLQAEKDALAETVESVRAELVHASAESVSLSAQLAKLRSQSDSSSSDVLSLTREMRELRGEMERLRIEREEWEAEAERERERREAIEDEIAEIERREMENQSEWERGRLELAAEKERADNLQDVLGEFQAAKDAELRQATSELESQLRAAATLLSEYKLRAANAETRLGEVGNDTAKSESLVKEVKEKNAIIAKLRHEAVVNNEHLTEALRRLRKNASNDNVDRRLVTNILLSFLTTQRADSKRFEMLSLLATILQWDDNERSKAGLQRAGSSGAAVKSPAKGKGRARGEERSAEEEAAMNESFSNLFVEFLLKEASQGQSRTPDSTSGPTSPTPHGASIPPWSPPSTNATNTPVTRSRGLSNSSSTSGPSHNPAYNRSGSWSLQQALSGEKP